MKRIISIIIGLISVLGLQAQVTECMRIYTDKDNYLAGEDLWIKVCVTDSAEAPSVKWLMWRSAICARCMHKARLP